MSDTFFPAPEPKTAISPDVLAQGVSQFRAPLGSFLGESALDGFWGTVAGQARAEGRIRNAELYAPEAELAPLEEEAWRNGEFHRERLSYAPGMTVARARAMAELYDENASRRAFLATRTDLGSQALGFAAGAAGSIATPENFIPFAGPALRAARAQRYAGWVSGLAQRALAAEGGGVLARAGAGALTGSIDGLLGSAVVMPSIVASREHFGDEVTWADMLQDLAFGAIGGGVLGAGAGAAFGRRVRAVTPEQAAGAASAEAEGMPPPVARQDSALQGLMTAADQVAETGTIDLSTVRPDVRDELLRAHAENARLRAALPPEAGGTNLSDRVASRGVEAVRAAAPGLEARATTPAGTEVRVRYEVVEAADLVTSHTIDFAENPAFPQDLQPRDRSGEERQQQVREIAARLRPEEVEASPLTSTGAPIVGPDGMVESGNGRTMAIALAYRDGLPTADAYRAHMLQAGFADAGRMQAPVLVRRRLTEMDGEARRRFTDESNADVIDALTPAEQAQADARRLTPAIVSRLAGADPLAAGNADFVRAFVGALPGRESRALATDGKLTADGATRIRRALAAYAYRDPDLVRLLAESADGQAEALGRGLMDAAPALARLRARIEAGEVRAELDPVPSLLAAAQRIRAARDAKLELGSVFDQADMFSAPGAIERGFLDRLLRHPNRPELGGVGRDTIAQRIGDVTDRAAEAPQEPDMFGEPPPGLGAVLSATLRSAGLPESPDLVRARAEPAADRATAAAAPEPDGADLFAAPEDLASPIPEPELPAGEGADPAAAAARDAGLDLGDGMLAAELARLEAAGRLDTEAKAAIAAADEMAALAERAPESWQAAASCAIRG